MPVCFSSCLQQNCARYKIYYGLKVSLSCTRLHVSSDGEAVKETAPVKRKFVEEPSGPSTDNYDEG